MCILIVLRGFHPDYPLVVAGNRDERIDRLASPPGLWVGERRAVLSPRDRRAGGTWLAVDERLAFAGITNLAGVPPVPEAPSRGHLVHLVLDQPDLDAGVDEVRRRVAADPYSGFQLVVGDRSRLLVLRHARGVLRVSEWTEPVLVVTNEHEPGQLVPRGLSLATAPVLALDQRLAALTTILRDRGGDGQHAICKRGDGYGTVSSSLLAIPDGDPLQLLWRYAPGPPDVTDYRNYGNLGRRLLPDPDAG
ncbi:MAG: NRDE family protein [Planctomycetota bacterium]